MLAHHSKLQDTLDQHKQSFPSIEPFNKEWFLNQMVSPPSPQVCQVYQQRTTEQMEEHPPKFPSP